jgi:hypothetical protein
MLDLWFTDLLWWIAFGVVTWVSLESATKLKVYHVILPFNFPCKLGSIRAITLFPFVFYAKRAGDDPCIRAHEMVHVQQVRRMGVLRFYVTYLWLKRTHGGHRGHPLEVDGYAAQDACNQALASVERGMASGKADERSNG